MRNIKAAILCLALYATPVYADEPVKNAHCVATTTDSTVITQCDNGTVSTVNGVSGVMVVCQASGANIPSCKKIDLREKP